ncbi:hypothetical protein [Paracoccus sp. SSK6]|uniref:hypothetical protein n=1 Tax=Paracoccus sp. SSK6 TaxID=3143131 RepID=UPI00321B70E8
MLGKYVELIARNSSSVKTSDTPIEVLGLYVSPETWVEAQNIMLAELSSKRVGLARVAAQEVIRTMRRYPALIECAGDLRERAEMLGGVALHGNADPRPRTLFHSSGASATGSRQDLVALTGLHYERVRDLLTGRRRYASGWALSAKEARKGPATPGRKNKAYAPPPTPAIEAPEPEFFQESGATFF